MRTLPALILLLVALLPMATGCSIADRRDIARAEALLDSLPDSALAILAPISPDRLSGELRARHALLLSQALDKNEIFIASDSVIAPAFAFYALDPTADPRRRLTTFYYKGIVEYNAAHPAEAIYYLAIADTLAARLADNRYRGLANAMMALAYSCLNDLDRDLEHSLRALRFFRAAADSANIRIALRNVAAAYVQTGQYDSALVYTDSISRDNNYYSVASSLIGLGRIEDYQRLEAKYPILANEPQIQSLYAFQLVSQGHTDEGAKILDNAYHLLSSQNDTITWITSRLVLLKSRNNLKEYNEALETLLKYHNSQSKAIYHQYSPSSQSDAKDFIAMTDAHVEAKKRTRLYIWIIFASLTALVAVMAMIIAHKSAQQKYERLKLQLAELSASKGSETGITSDAMTSDYDTDTTDLIRFVDERKHNLDNLFNRYISLPSSDNTSPRRMLRDEIDSYRSFDFNERLDRVIDLLCDNYMAKAKAAHLPAPDLSLLRLTICGFTNPQIGIILDENKGTIATRRSRLKGKILKAGLPAAPVI